MCVRHVFVWNVRESGQQKIGWYHLRIIVLRHSSENIVEYFSTFLCFTYLVCTHQSYATNQTMTFTIYQVPRQTCTMSCKKTHRDKHFENITRLLLPIIRRILWIQCTHLCDHIEMHLECGQWFIQSVCCRSHFEGLAAHNVELCRPVARPWWDKRKVLRRQN